MLDANEPIEFSKKSVRAALDAIISFGRPEKVELLTLVDRSHSRDLPIEAHYVGRKVNTLPTQKVLVSLKEQEGDDSIWLVNKEEE